MIRLGHGIGLALLTGWAAALLVSCGTTAAGPGDVPDPPPDGGSDAAIVDSGSDAPEASDAGDAGDGAVPDTSQLLHDHRFLDGFNTYPVEPSTTPVDVLLPPTSTGDPVWRLVEWYTQQLLTPGPPTMTPSGAEWVNAYKRVVVADGFVELAINADAEYGGQYRQRITKSNGV